MKFSPRVMISILLAKYPPIQIDERANNIGDDAYLMWLDGPMVYRKNALVLEQWFHDSLYH